MKNMYRGVREIFSRYWSAYGGMTALVCSPYLHVAVVLSLAAMPIWYGESWWELPLGVLPNLLGFTLGGFAMFLGFGDEKFRALLAEPGEAGAPAPSMYVSLCATFVHFICIQVLALLFAILANAWNFYVPWPDAIRQTLNVATLVFGFLGYVLFLYSITSVLAATMYVFRVATWYENYQRLQMKKPGPP